MSLIIPKLKRAPGWYWKEHGSQYKRQSVEDIRRFCGWPFLMKLIDLCGKTQYRTDQCEHLRNRDKGLVAALFLSGGRVSEVVSLRKENFDFETGKERGVVLIKDMKLSKRYRKVQSWTEIVPELPQNITKRLYSYDEKEAKYTRIRWETEKVEAFRRDLPILTNTKLYPYLELWLNTIEDYLFPSVNPQNISRLHLTTTRIYQIISNLGERLKVPLYPHWFRSMRATQLVLERHYNLDKLLDFFGWKDILTARRYTHLSWEDLL